MLINKQDPKLQNWNQDKAKKWLKPLLSPPRKASSNIQVAQVATWPVKFKSKLCFFFGRLFFTALCLYNNILPRFLRMHNCIATLEGFWALFQSLEDKYYRAWINTQDFADLLILWETMQAIMLTPCLCNSYTNTTGPFRC